MTYGELEKGIEDAPITYLPSLLITVLEAAIRRDVFVSEGGVERFTLATIARLKRDARRTRLGGA